MDEKNKKLSSLSSEQFSHIYKTYYDNNSNTRSETGSTMAKNVHYDQFFSDNQQQCVSKTYRTSTSETYDNRKRYSETSFGSYSSISSTQSYCQILPKPKSGGVIDNNIITNGTKPSILSFNMKSSTSPQQQYQTNNKLYTNAISYEPPKLFSKAITSTEPSTNLIQSQSVIPKKSVNKIKTSDPAKFIIINFKKFDQIGKLKLKTREGSEKDVKDLERTFKSLKMKGRIYKDLKLKELEKEMEKVSKEDFSKNSAIVMAIMSHGGRSSELYAKDGSFKLHSTIIKKLFQNKDLTDKPKIIFVEACKGETDPRWSLDTNNSGSGQGVIIFYAAFEDYVSYTDKIKGSFFTQSLCENLQKLGKTEDILKIFKAVIDDVYNTSGKIQTPTMENNLTKDYCFGTYCNN